MRQWNRGFILPPQIMAMAPQLMVYGAIVAATVIAMLSAGLWVQTNRLETAQGFVKAATALGKAQEIESKRKEKENADNIKTALSGRDTALAELERLRISAGRRPMPKNPTAPEGSDKVCFRAEAYNAAFKRFGEQYGAGLQGFIGFAIEGDSAQVDAQTLVNGWPK